MKFAEQVAAVERLGYTAREASFLVTAALHSGYFLMRQFQPDGGKVAHRFGEKLLALRHVTIARCLRNTFLFHVQAKELYRAIGQENNRHRRVHNPFHVRSKVMGLDYVLAHPQFRFLPTEAEKVAYFCGERGLPERVLPAKTYAGKGGNTSRYFVDKYPLRIGPETANISFCFVDDAAFGGLGFATWLDQYEPLIRSLERAEVVYVSADPMTFSSARTLFEQRFLGSGSAFPSADLIAYFAMRKDFDAAGYRGRSQAALDTLRRLKRTFADPKFEDQYLVWLSGSQPHATAPSATFTTYHLSFSYRFFGVKA